MRNWTGAVGLDLPHLLVGKLKQGSNPHIRETIWGRGKTFKAKCETADMWQPKWNENQTVLAVAIHNPDRNAGPLESAAVGSWSLVIVEQSQGEGCCWMQRSGLRKCEGGDPCGKCWWGKARQPWKQGNTAESRVGGGAMTIASLSPHSSTGSWTVERLAHQMPEVLNYRVRTPPRIPL